MSVKNPPPEFVIRFGGVSIDRDELTKSLGVDLDRYEPSPHESSHYAQISLSGDVDHWTSIAEFLDAVGPRIKALIGQRLIGSASMDFAVYIPRDAWAASMTVPAAVALRASQNLIDIETSTYLTNSGA
ncbi:MAG: hypothetical protein IPK59_11335 [Rhodospirillaceae bacterium]|nr:hypothetical protein [Rhodospirillaceae bacterium]